MGYLLGPHLNRISLYLLVEDPSVFTVFSVFFVAQCYINWFGTNSSFAMKIHLVLIFTVCVMNFMVHWQVISLILPQKNGDFLTHDDFTGVSEGSQWKLTAGGAETQGRTQRSGAGIPGKSIILGGRHRMNFG